MSWLQKLFPSRIRTSSTKRKGVPEGLWTKCAGCQAILYRSELEKNLGVCPKCGHHHRVGARQRLSIFLDEKNRTEIAKELQPVDRLKFKDSKRYRDRISQAQKQTGENDALVVMSGTVEGLPIVAAAFEFGFMGGSMGSVVGQKFVEAVNCAMKLQCPLICFSASGGARMQEGVFSLLQMAKSSAALANLAKQGLPYVSVLTDPTMGGVSASFATLGDIIIAEPKALIGFAGPRVIEQTVRQVLPEGFQRSEFLMEHGHIDMVVERHQLVTIVKRTLTRLMASHVK